ncbi:hypothetical protein AOL_s00176g3 [Orbilia oligospora ATCC 24927]|uniref:DUF4246 domain-containing protein n=2 Tax=Orbilia oligospora TaxID=2813651 RepID=G1XPM9_ARTOA|nr:hypothetical protein AOL_s00176g3 [Orbilia oligospora ATCC 24927]EGX44832.1 hypothetical protein AOL_s00176g3 [Orbilia oligospora ATCC 24927]KAF3284283.1 hypothetical protein TWF970_011503 [Orbilia oligospora]
MYPHPLDSDWNPDLITYPKYHHRAFIVSALNKPDWTTQAADKSIVARWFREAQERDNKFSVFRVLHHRTWNESDVKYAWQELSNCRKYVESLRTEGCKVEPDIRGIWKADGMVSEELREKLVKATSSLERIMGNRITRSNKIGGFDTPYQDYEHRNFVQFINPSLWPVIYGKTRNIADAMPIELPEELLRPRGINCFWRGYSNKLCCLPTEFEVSADGKQTKVLSYINNLPQSDEQELGLRRILGEIFTCFVPLFNHVLADLSRPQPKGAPAIELLEFIPTAEYLQEWKEAVDRFEHEEDSDPGIFDYMEEHCMDHVQCREKKKKCKKVCHIERLDRWDIWTPPPMPDALRLEGRKLKVFVELSSIHLSPETGFEYRQGDWRTNARLNERIVATGVYCIERENITEVQVEFKMSFLHNLSGIPIKEHRAIAFPNILEYRTQPFKLVDRQRPGHLKMLKFYLCDPTDPYEIPTTTTVAPQQKGEIKIWLVDQLRQGKMGRLPEEIFEQIVDHIVQAMEPGITVQAAEKYSSRAQFSKAMCGI